MSRASYRVKKGTHAIYVIDQDAGMSVTNDAEAVVHEVLTDFGKSLPIYYRDSSGLWDELVHDGFQFTGFAFGVKRPLAAAELKTLFS